MKKEVTLRDALDLKISDKKYFNKRLTLTTRRFHTHMHTLTQARARAITHKRNAVCTYVCIFASVFIKLYIDRPFQLERTQARVMTKIQFNFQKFYRKIFKMLKNNQESGSKELKCRIPRGMMSKFKCIVIFITYPIILASSDLPLVSSPLSTFNMLYRTNRFALTLLWFTFEWLCEFSRKPYHPSTERRKGRRKRGS